MPSYSVITNKCIKDNLCVAGCLRKAIHPKETEPGYAEAKQLFINPKKCLSCGTCITTCKSGAIFAIEDLPEEFKEYAAINAAHFKK